MQPSVATFRAISDPTRRAILDVLASGEHAAGELGERFPITQPALSQHLRVLREAGLVTPRRDGRRRLYRLRPEPLRAVYDWIAHYERFWDQKLDALGDYLDSTTPADLDPRPTPTEPDHRPITPTDEPEP